MTACWRSQALLWRVAWITLSIRPPHTRTRTLSFWTPPLASTYIRMRIRITAITVWFCDVNERMTEGLCWQGGGAEIRGAVRNLLREGQLRTEQRASEGGEFPSSVAFRAGGELELRRKLIGFGLAGLLLIGAYHDVSARSSEEVQILIWSQWFADLIWDVSSSSLIVDWFYFFICCLAEMKSHKCEMLQLQIGTSHWRPVFCFDWFISLFK